MLTVVLQKPGQSFPVQHCSAGLLVMTCRSVKAGNCSKCLASASVDPEHEFELLAAQHVFITLHIILRPSVPAPVCSVLGSFLRLRAV